ncbi:MAG: hypothetical protein ABI658_18745 [Acidimicrobiales bacterium]
MGLALRHRIHRPMQHAAGRRGVARATRLTFELLTLAVVVVTVMALTAMGRPTGNPPAAVAPSVAIIDAVCITNTPDQTPC